MNLIQELKDGENDSDGVRRPPTRLALQASRKLKEMLSVIEGLEIAVTQERKNVENLLNENYLLKEQNAKYLHESTTLRNDGGQTSEVGIGNGESRLSGSNQSNQASAEHKDSSVVPSAESSSA